MPTEVIKTVKPAGGGDYASIQAWWDAEKGNLVLADEVRVAECYGGNIGALNALVTDAVTDATRYFVIRAADGEAHSGVWDTSKVYSNGSSGAQFVMKVAYTRLKGLLIETTDVAAGVPAFAPQGDFMLIEDCIARNVNGFAAQVYCQTAGNFATVRNSAFYHGTGADQNCVQVSSVVPILTGVCAKFYNCFFVELRGSGDACIEAVASSPPSTQVITQNCYFKAVDIAYGGNGGYEKGANDATSNSEATDPALRNVAFSTDNFAVVTPFGSIDLHLQAGSILLEAAEDLSGQGWQTDWEGDDRGDTNVWDIGADQLTVPTPPVLFEIDFDADAALLVEIEKFRRGAPPGNPPAPAPPQFGSQVVPGWTPRGFRYRDWMP